jgi:tRNA-specific 2-thiouridylase
MKERIVVGMSGGVDSSVAAALLVEQGYDVVGITMRVAPSPTGEETASRFGSCCGTEATDDAREVARALGIRHYLLNMADEFERKVIGNFVAAYGAGRTPVPCVACNSDLKFGSLLGARTGVGRRRRRDRPLRAHRARFRDGPPSASARRDPRKDQTDFLWPLSQAQLAAARFPVGRLDKDEVRANARRLGLVTADKPESQEICFVPDDDYRGFLRRRATRMFRPGAIVDRRAACRDARGDRRVHDRPAPRPRPGDQPSSICGRPRPAERSRDRGRCRRPRAAGARGLARQLHSG